MFIAMNIWGLFRKQEIISQGHMVKGTVVSAKTCWWLKINTKPIRTSSMDGAAFSHIISFRYDVDSVEYRGRQYVSWTDCCPVINETIDVYYDVSKPSVYAVDI